MIEKLTSELKKIEKRNLIELVKHHKKNCDGENCNISLFMILQIAERAGLKFTKKEKMYFI
jgi:hypothetical protein